MTKRIKEIEDLLFIDEKKFKKDSDWATYMEEVD